MAQITMYVIERQIFYICFGLGFHYYYLRAVLKGNNVLLKHKHDDTYMSHVKEKVYIPQIIYNFSIEIHHKL